MAPIIPNSPNPLNSNTNKYATTTLGQSPRRGEPQCPPLPQHSLPLRPGSPPCPPLFEIRPPIQYNTNQGASAKHNSPDTKLDYSFHSGASNQSGNDSGIRFRNDIVLAMLTICLAASLLDIANNCDLLAPVDWIIETALLWSIWFSVLSVSTHGLHYLVTAPKGPMVRLLSNNHLEVIEKTLVSGSRKTMVVGMISLAFGLFAFAFTELSILSTMPMSVLGLIAVVALLVLMMAASMYVIFKNARRPDNHCASLTPPNMYEIPEIKEVV